MPIALPEPVSLAVEALDLEVAITAAETQDATAELPHEELFDVSTEDGVIQIVQRERYWKSKFAKRTSFLSFGGPKIVISLPHDSFLDVLRVQTNSTCRLEGVRTTHADFGGDHGYHSLFERIVYTREGDREIFVREDGRQYGC